MHSRPMKIHQKSCVNRAFWRPVKTSLIANKGVRNSLLGSTHVLTQVEGENSENKRQPLLLLWSVEELPDSGEQDRSYRTSLANSAVSDAISRDS